MTTTTHTKLTDADRATLAESGAQTADVEWDSLVEESSISTEWSSDGDEPWHCLPCNWDDLDDDARDEAYRIFGQAARSRWSELLQEQRDRVLARAREIATPDGVDREKLYNLIYRDDSEVGTAPRSPADDEPSRHASALMDYAIGIISTEPRSA